MKLASALSLTALLFLSQASFAVTTADALRSLAKIIPPGSSSISLKGKTAKREACVVSLNVDGTFGFSGSVQVEDRTSGNGFLKFQTFSREITELVDTPSEIRAVAFRKAHAGYESDRTEGISAKYSDNMLKSVTFVEATKGILGSKLSTTCLF